jgi:heterodisulfide reductase subunit A-like polyferredoxin
MGFSGDGKEGEGDVIGAVLVVGAGIGGIQASLDLAEAGFKVYLLDKSPAIGGVMAQLDKTFPTNDCAMCILSPKLVECGRHLNVEVMTYAELESVEGEPGNWRVCVRQKPRYVVVDECTGCDDCAAACPIVRPDQFNIGLSQRRAAYKLYPQAIPNAYVIEKRGRAPCRNVCPIHQRAQGYVALIREGRFADAYRTIREDNPFPSICGRVCNHRCEDDCSRGKVDEPVNIMRLKRFVADWALAHPDEVAGQLTDVPFEPTGKQVAVVGSGPAGLTCAQDLAKLGHHVTVFEALPVPGGMMRVGIPAHRLPHELVQREVDDILALGVELTLNHRVEDVMALLGDSADKEHPADKKHPYDAVFAAMGAHRGVRLPIPGVDLPEVTVATDFLRRVALGEQPEPCLCVEGRRVLVLGGGSVAVDAATTALRLGASWVGMTCLESRETMPAHGWEILDAQEEGIDIFPSRTFKEITCAPSPLTSPSGGGTASGERVTGVRCAEIDFRGFVDGRPDFDEIPDTEHVIEADVVIFAIGQRSDVSCLPEEVTDVRGRLRTSAVDPVTLATEVPGLFAGGVVVTGPGFVVDAIAAGHKAARSIHAYLCGEPLPEAEPEVKVAELSEEEAKARVAAGSFAGEISGASRHEVVKLAVAERVRGFQEVYPAFTEEEARAEAARCLSCGTCSECLQCVYACQKHCIDHDMREELVELSVGAVVLVPGVEVMAGDVRPEFGYGRSPNVVTSIELERMLSASGPWGGEVRRPSDGEHPRKVAFIQCVGSRDASCDQGYCSSVCCMYATKEAVIAKEHDPNVEPTIFYMDIRSFGKGFERYVGRAEQEYGVRYVRSMVSRVREVPGTGSLRLEYATSDGKSVEEEFDLVVLSVGLRPPEGAQELAERLGIGLNEYGFAESSLFQPGRLVKPDGSLAGGMFVAGPFSEPKDIPETVIEASCAAAQVSALLAGARGTLTEARVWPEERDVSQEPPRVGVFICHCGINIGAVVNVPEVVEHAASLPGVAYAEHNLYTCSQDTQERIRERIQEHELNRVVVASCTPRTHEPLFQETIRGAGLNPHLFEMANIREQDSWVHRDNHHEATEKAKELVRMAVAKARRLRPVESSTFEVNRRALVVGGGLAGMVAALSIAEQGFGVTLVEREPELGGNLRHIYTALPDGHQMGGTGGYKPSEGSSLQNQDTDPQELLRRTLEAISAEPRISVLTGAEVVDVGGYVGQYCTLVRMADGRQEEVQHGVIVVATGARQIEPHEYCYGQDRRVVTQREFEKILIEENKAGLPSSVVMIQCVGSRDEEHPYCSRVCCTEAIKNALAIKERSPETEVYVLYRDVRTFGFKERYYREARRKGVVFLQYDEDQKPQVRDEADTNHPEGRLYVDVTVQPEGETFTLGADLVVLSAGIEPNVDNAALARLLKVPLDEDGFFLEAHVKLRPLDFAADGVYLCGMAHSPRFLDEAIAQAQGAAVRAVGLLSKDELEATPIVASVNPRLCSACGLCVEVCPYDARVLEPGAPYAEVIEVLCQGCGACIVACPNKASQQKGFEVPQVYGMLDSVLTTPTDRPRSDCRGGPPDGSYPRVRPIGG